jgi:hypothetical protein
MARKGIMPAGLKRYWAARRGKTGKKRSVRMAVQSRSKKFTLPVAVVLGFTPLVARAVDLTRSFGFANALQVLPTSLIPYNVQTRKMDFGQLSNGLYPIIAGLAVHKIVGGMLGVNRALAAARVPLLRL